MNAADMRRDFDGKTALVTGGGSGIGKAAALLFGRRGANVVIADLHGASAEAVAKEICDAGGSALAVQADVTSETAVSVLVARAVEQFGGLDCAFNNAGLSGAYTPFHEVTIDDWDRIIAVDLTSVFLCMKHEIAHMLANGGGAIVNTASGAGFVPAPGQPHYTAAKHGVLGLTKTAAQEYARHGIRVNAVCPGVTDTPMMQGFIGGDASMEKMMLDTLPAGRMGRPDEIAEAVVWLCSDAASFVSGDSMLVDGASVCR